VVGTIGFRLNDSVSRAGTAIEPSFLVPWRDGWLETELIFRWDGGAFFPATVRAVPEPSSAALVAGGLGILVAWRRRWCSASAALSRGVRCRPT